jgi:hypothetical protein
LYLSYLILYFCGTACKHSQLILICYIILYFGRTCPVLLAFIHVSNMYFLSVYTSELFLFILLCYISYTSTFSVCIYVISFCTFLVLHILHAFLGCNTLVYNSVLLLVHLLYFIKFFVVLMVISFCTSVVHTLYFRFSVNTSMFSYSVILWYLSFN